MSKKALLFIMITLAASWILTGVLYALGVLSNLVILIMIVPALVAVLIRLIASGLNKEIFFNPDAKGFFSFLKAFVFAIAFPVAVITACAVLGALIYGEELSGDFFNRILNGRVMAGNIIFAAVTPTALLALGEEYGWRGFLLPEMLKTRTAVWASTVIGIVWALYHFPVMVLLNVETFGLQKALWLAVIQGAAAFVFSYAFSYVYLISKRLYPSVVMHSFWNIMNPAVLGSIYTNRAGLVLRDAPIYVINGEGIFGIVFAGLAAIIIVLLMRKKEKANERAIQKD